MPASTSATAASDARRTPCRGFPRRGRTSRCGQLLFQQLFLVEIGVQAIAGHQRVVRTAFRDATPLEDEDLIGVPNGRYAVGHDDGGTLAHDAAQPRQDFL